MLWAKSRFKFWVGMFIVIFLLGCQPHSQIKSNSNEEDELRRAISQYYQLEKEQIWSKAYERRPPNFRQSVPKDFYIESMEKYLWTVRKTLNVGENESLIERVKELIELEKYVESNKRALY